MPRPPHQSTYPPEGSPPVSAVGGGPALPYSSTTLNLASKHCAHALDHAAAGTPYDRDVFTAGTVAHAILQSVANWQAAHPDEHEVPHVETADRQLQEMLGKGRTYRGTPEPPPNPDDAWRGHRVALDYLSENPVPLGLPEVEVKGTVEGLPVAALLDLVYTSWDLATGETMLCVDDYKSSWQSDADELETVQRKLQGLLAWYNRDALAAALPWSDQETADHEPFDGLRLSVVNLRNGNHYSRELRGEMLDDLLARWEREVAVTVRGLEDAKVPCLVCEALKGREDERPTDPPCEYCHGLGYTRVANPGPRCMGCPYVLACDAASEFWREAPTLLDSKDMAKTYSILSAARDAIAKHLREATKEQPIAVPGGEVGYRRKDKTVSKAGHAETVWAKWHSRSATEMLSPGEVVGLLEAASITGYGLKTIAQVLWPGRDKESIQRRAKWLGTVTESKPGKEFGSWKS